MKTEKFVHTSSQLANISQNFRLSTNFSGKICEVQ